MIRYGILSTASIVERFVAGIRESKDGYVLAIASRTEKKAREAAKKLNIPNYYATYQALFEDPDIDVIYIPTVNAFHYQDCLNALEHHKHVIVEKPFTLNSDQANELFEIARKNHCFLMEAQKAVFLPATQKLKELVQDNIIGPIKYVEFKAGFPKRFTYDHWMYHHELGGGSLYGSASYTIELLQYVFDLKPSDISGTLIECPTKADEICNFQLKMNQDILISSTIAMNVPLKNEAVFYGENGYIVVPYFWKSSKLDIYNENGLLDHYDFPYQSEFVYEIEHIHQCLKQQLLESPIMTKEKTLTAVSLVEELYRQWHI